MNARIEFQGIQHRRALDDWYAACKRRMGLRFPKIDFDTDHWPIKTIYATDQKDWYFTEPSADFAAKDMSYRDALRCLVAEIVLAGKPKSIDFAISPYRQLALISRHRLFDLTIQDLRELESNCLRSARAHPQSANSIKASLSGLARQLTQLADKGVISRLGFNSRAEVKAELRKIMVTYRARLRAGKGDLLDRKMEAFNDAFNTMVTNPLRRDGRPVLSTLDREALCASALALCAPSRINEVLCLSVDDFVTVEDYAQKSLDERDVLHRAHQMLIVTMKGSKGAEWSPKPVLNFMIDVFHYCIDIIKKQGKRSRMLVDWYQKNPATLYLPPELEYLRGQAITRRRLAKVIQLTENPTVSAVTAGASHIFKRLKNRQFKGANPDCRMKNGNINSNSLVHLVSWADIEALLLNRVHEAMDSCRRVTPFNHYKGNLAKMLFLFDRDELPFLPYAVNYQILKRYLKETESDRKHTRPPTIFEKLNITMPVAGKIQIAELDTHDPRRWLTTMALIQGQDLSDILINKWANRCKLSHLKSYDFRTAETMATESAMPEASKLIELTDLSNGLAAVEKMEEQFGLTTATVTAHDAGIAMTSMDKIVQAVENRPVAKSSRGIIIIYPQRFGVCFHQHHEKPCRNYSNDLAVSCVTCNEGAFTKGHIPTNDETRKVANQLLGSVVRHLENLAHTHNRNVADDPATLGEHMLALVEKGLSKATLEKCAIHLIEEIHQINHLLKDRLLARRLEQTFVAREVVTLLDDPSVKNGALIKYHNPTQHSEPLLEIALDARDGREQVARDEQQLVEKYPQFAPKAMNLKDERHLIEPDDEEEED